MPATSKKIICEARETADGVGIEKGGRMAACFPVSQYGSLMDAHRAASEYAYEFGGNVVFYVVRWACHRN
jgi:hypothetical protein